MERGVEHDADETSGCARLGPHRRQPPVQVVDRPVRCVQSGYVDARRSLASTGRLMGAVVLRALDQADRTHESMLVRLYEGRLPMAELGPIRRAQVLVLTAGLAVLAGAFVLCQFVLCQKGPI